ncbi:hypothetical protein D9M69_716870 [compost metagenome]
MVLLVCDNSARIPHFYSGAVHHPEAVRTLERLPGVCGRTGIQQPSEPGPCRGHQALRPALHREASCEQW